MLPFYRLVIFCTTINSLANTSPIIDENGKSPSCSVFFLHQYLDSAEIAPNAYPLSGEEDTLCPTGMYLSTQVDSGEWCYAGVSAFDEMEGSIEVFIYIAAERQKGRKRRDWLKS